MTRYEGFVNSVKGITFPTGKARIDMALAQEQEKLPKDVGKLR